MAMLAPASPLRFSPRLLPSSHPNRLSPPPPISHRCHRRRRRDLPPVLRVATPAQMSEDEPRALEIEEQPDSYESFSWREHWYPVSLVEDLNPRLPTPFQLLNRDIVLWKEPKTGDWSAFDDRCPHRLAPLSEGRIDEDGCLQCSYHGWSFNGKGTCTKIPQASSEGPEARAAQSPRASAVKLPTLVSQGLLFVWPDENGWEKASQTKPPLLPDVFNGFSPKTMQRDVFYGYDTFMENESDPSHVNFAHHKVIGRRESAAPVPFELESSGVWGFSGSNAGNPRITVTFVAPCLHINKIEIDANEDQKQVTWICSFNIPMAPGKTRSMIISAPNFFQFQIQGIVWQLMRLVPRWLEHWTSNKVYDGDITFLQGQEKNLLSKSMAGAAEVNQQYTKITFTPTQADRFVLAFRNWLRQHGNGEPEWFGVANQQSLPSTVLSKRQLMDRYELHTLICSSCKRAFNGFQTLQKVLVAATAVLCASSGVPSDTLFRVLLGGAAVGCAALAFALHELQKNFVFVDYVHGEVD